MAIKLKVEYFSASQVIDSGFINGIVITSLMDKDSFPEFFEESMKGDGYFAFEVKPLTFTIITIGTNIAPSRGDWIVIEDTITGQQLLKGKIDEIQGDDTPTPEITVFPQALLLKDYVVGDEVELSSTETVTDFSWSVKSIRDIVVDILSRFNTSEGSQIFRANNTSIPDFAVPGRWFGNVLKKLGGFSLSQAILNAFGYDDSYYFTKTAGDDYYFIHEDGTFILKRVLRRGQWVDITLSYSGRIISFNLGSIQVPPVNWDIPWPSRVVRVWSCIGGGLNPVNEYAIEDIDIDSAFGSKYSGQNIDNVPTDMLEGFAEEKGFIADINVLASFDSDASNTYALIEGRRKNSFSNSKIVVSFETAFDNSYAGHYRNSTAMEVLRDLSVASNRWLYVDRTGLVYLLPRSQSRGSVTFPEGKTLSVVKKVRSEDEIEVKINRYEENDDGEVSAFGLKLRKNELEAIQGEYRTLFSGNVEERDFELHNLIGDDILKEVTWRGNSIGYIISLEHSFLEPIAKAKVENVL